jgi:hypothetical protein
MTKYRRSSLGGHWTGTGVAGPTSQQFDDFKKSRSIKVYKPGMFEFDKFGNDKKGKAAFEEYCREQSGDVISYKINQDEETPK